MKKLVLFLTTIPIFAAAQQIDSTVSFGPDTVMYTLDGKASDIDAYYMNTTVQYTGYAQYYDCPQPLTVSGFCFYAWVENTGMTADVVCSIHEPLADSLPGAVISSDTLTVDDTFSFSDFDLIRYCAEFDTPVNRTQPYVVSVQTSSPLDLNIISNDAANNDGAGEALAFYYWSGTNPGWTHNEEFFSWDIDWVLCPIVNFDLNVQAVFDADTICQEDTINVSATMPPIWSHRMYNKRAFDNVEWMDVSWLISQNPPFLGYDVGAPVQQHGDVPINMFVEYNGWRNTTMFPFSANIYTDPQPVAGFEHNAGQLDVQFTDTSLFADSIQWDLGDGSPITNEQNPFHIYPAQGWYTVQQVAFNDCGTDTAWVDVQVMTTGMREDESQKLKVYPNPTSGILNIESDLQKGALQLLDNTGRVVFQSDLSSNRNFLELDGSIRSGAYQLRLVTEDQVLTTQVQVIR